MQSQYLSGLDLKPTGAKNILTPAIRSLQGHNLSAQASLKTSILTLQTLSQPLLHLSNAAPIGREPGSSKKLSWLPTSTSSVVTDSLIGPTSPSTCQIVTLTTRQLA